MKKVQTIFLHDHGSMQMLYFTCSSLSADDERIYLISDHTGSPNVFVRDLRTGAERQLTKTGRYASVLCIFRRHA